jgi:hypothetical protein
VPGIDGLDPAPHIGQAFRDAFPTWRDLIAFIAAHATTPAFDVDRAARQLLMTDLLARFTAVDGFGWVLRGSLALPARPTPRTGSPRTAIAPILQSTRLRFSKWRRLCSAAKCSLRATWKARSRALVISSRDSVMSVCQKYLTEPPRTNVCHGRQHGVEAPNSAKTVAITAKRGDPCRAHRRPHLALAHL